MTRLLRRPVPLHLLVAFQKLSVPIEKLRCEGQLNFPRDHSPFPRDLCVLAIYLQTHFQSQQPAVARSPESEEHGSSGFVTECDAESLAASINASSSKTNARLSHRVGRRRSAFFSRPLAANRPRITLGLRAACYLHGGCPLTPRPSSISASSQRSLQAG